MLGLGGSIGRRRIGRFAEEDRDHGTDCTGCGERTYVSQMKKCSVDVEEK